MAAREFGSIADDGRTNDIATELDEDADETTQSSPRASVDNTGDQSYGHRIDGASSRKYAPREDAAPSKASPVDASETSSEEVKQTADYKGVAAAKEIASNQSELKYHGGGFHDVAVVHKNKKPIEQEDGDDDEKEEDGGGQYQLVKKSVYKPPKKGSILQRLAGIAGGGSKAKYAIPPRDLDAALAAKPDGTGEERGGGNCGANTSDGSKLEDVDLDDSTDVDDMNSAIVVEEEEIEPIDVAIDRSPDRRDADQSAQEDRKLPSPVKSPRHQHHNRDEAHEYVEDPFITEAAALQDPPQVVIHSGESDSETGFAMVNPVIAARRKFHGPARFAAVASADASPFLVEIPTTTSSGEHANGSAIVTPSSLLVINALGASGLLKVEKFGTQSALLELQLCSRSSQSRGLDPISQPSVMRTCLHKKGGSEAQWNQQFTAALQSKQEQFIRATVRTNSRMVVGVAEVSLDEVGDLFYDQHYPLYRLEDDVTDDAGLSSREANHEPKLGCPAGYVHLQLKIVDTSIGQASPVAVPRLHLPFPTASGPLPPSSAFRNSSGSGSIPRDLAKGSLLYKVPYHKSGVVGYTAIPRRMWVSVVENEGGERLITWADPTASTSSNNNKKSSSGVRSLGLALVTEVREGHNTKAFEAHKASNVVKEKEKCFSLVAKNRTLDLVAASKEEATIWVAGLRELLFPTTKPSYSSASLTSARMIHDYREVALSSGRPNDGVGAAALDPVKKKQQLAVWRSQVFDLAHRNHIDAIASCLHDGCPIDLLETGTGDTLLIIACRLGNAPLVELCLSWRAKNDPHPEFGDTALQAAVAHQHADCLKLLLLTAAKSDMDSEIVNHIDSNSDAPLHVAARNGDFACLQHLLLHGADICVVDEIGRTPLQCAVSTAQQGGADCVAYLLDVGGDSVLNLGDHEGDTPLHYAALAGNESAVKLLLESAADAFAVNSNGETPFDVAMRERHQRCADLIAPYCTSATVDDKSEQSTSDRVAAGADHHGDASEEEQEEEDTPRRQRHLRRHHRHVSELDEGDREEDNEDEYGSSSASDRDAAYDSSGYSLSQLESSSRDLPMEYLQRPWSATDRVYHLDQDDRRRQRFLDAPSTRPAPPHSTPSPSEQVRAALARHQRSFSVVAGGRPPMSARSAFDGTPQRNISLSASSSSHYYPATARDWSPPRSEHQLLYWVNGRQVSTERFDRLDADRAALSHAAQGLHHLQPQSDGGGYRTGYAFDPVAYGSSSNRARSRSEDTSSPSWGYRSDSQTWADNDSRPTRAGDYSNGSAYSTAAWATEHVACTPSRQDQWARRPATAGSVSSAPLWDLLYTEDGYPYYVNRQTSVSQWEKPPDAEIAPPSAQATSRAVASTRGPDEIIRMRLAQARRQQSMPAAMIRTHQSMLGDMQAAREGEEAESSGYVGSTSTFAAATTSSAELTGTTTLAEGPVNMSAAHDEPRSRDALEVVPTTSVDSLPMSAASQSPPEVLQSTYENRTGLKLSIDISSPPSKEHVRPAFVPSPRSKSGATPTASGQTTADGTSETSKPDDGSFQKSRPSSPRGRSKNVSLIDLKRANNLAIALASFKIHDRYEQIVDGIITMDESVISASLLACLQRYFPTEQERDTLQCFHGDVSTLGKPERFFYLLFQVPSVQMRVEMFLYKLEFGRMKQTLLGRILVVKRACRDLAENFAFVEAIDRFFAQQQQRTLALLDQNREVFKLKFLAEADEKLASFRGDLEKASSVDLTDLQLQLNRLLSGRHTVQSFVDQNSTVAHSHGSTCKDTSDAEDKAASGACDILERFLLETRKPMADVEAEFESMEQWSDRLLAVFGENKATCRLADMVECILRLL